MNLQLGFLKGIRKKGEMVLKLFVQHLRLLNVNFHRFDFTQTWAFTGKSLQYLYSSYGAET